MGLYSRLEPKAKTVVDTVFAGTTEKEIKAMGLPDPMELDRRLKILYTGRQDLQQSIREDYGVAVAVRRLGMELNSVQIGEQIGRSCSTIKGWLKGSRPGDFGRLSDINEYRIPTEKSVEFARFLGFILSTRGRQSRKGVLEFGSMDERLRKEFDDTVQKLWGRNSKDLKDEEGRVKGKLVSSKEVKNYLELVTDGWTTLPWEHLVERDERQAFLRAWLSNSSSILKPTESRRFRKPEGKPQAEPKETIDRRMAVVDIEKTFEGVEGKKDPRLDLFRDLRILLLDLGFGNTLIKQGGNRYAVRIHDLDDLQKLADESYFLQDERNETLRKAVKESRGLQGASNTRHEYELFRKLVSEGMSIKEAAEKFELYPETALKWINGTQKPTPVKWDDEVRKLKEERKPGEIGYAFRNIAQEPAEARRLAKENSMRQLEDIKRRTEVEGFLWDTGLPLLPGEYWPISNWSLSEVRRFIESKRPALVQRIMDIRDRLMNAEEQTVLKVVRQLPNREVYERSLLQARSNKHPRPEGRGIHE